MSGRITQKDLVRRVIGRLEGLGCSITHDWTRVEEVTDGTAHDATAGVLAQLDIRGVIESDVYVLVSDGELAGKGMHAELGAALAMQQLAGKPEIYVVGPSTNRSIFYMHPGVTRLESVDQLVAHLQADMGPRPSPLLEPA